MRGFKPIAAMLAAVVAFAACDNSPVGAPDSASAGDAVFTLESNGFPQGAADYHLNIIGVPRDKSASMDNNNGHRIFVQLESDNEVTNPGGK
ncbi:MAG: hypothetical protein ABFS14_11495, partial [Gemmatimonadota bacterium]